MDLGDNLMAFSVSVRNNKTAEIIQIIEGRNDIAVVGQLEEIISLCLDFISS